jgi:exosortase/archaeosortase family protein
LWRCAALLEVSEMRALTIYRTPAAIRSAAWISTCPAWVCIALAAAALWPSWQWAAARMTDGSDDPLGIAAAAVIALVLWADRKTMRITPARNWLAVAGGGVLAATLLAGHLPPLMIALIAALALTAAIAASAPHDRPVVPLAGLLVLALPVISSLQFYAGFPLRVLTAEASKIGLKLLGYAAERIGSAMVVDGKLIIVDAPCSGVQMVWLAYFTALAVAALRRLPTRALLLRLPLVGLLVLAGNVLRNVILVMYEVESTGWPTWTHDAVGLAVLAMVCSTVGLLTASGARKEQGI